MTEKNEIAKLDVNSKFNSLDFKKYDLKEGQAKAVKEKYAEDIKDLMDLKEKIDKVSELDVSKENAKKTDDVRLEVYRKRQEIQKKVKKNIKDAKNICKYEAELMEAVFESLKEVEFALGKNKTLYLAQENKKIIELQEAREKELEAFGGFGMAKNLGQMKDDDWKFHLAGARALFQEAEEEKKAERKASRKKLLKTIEMEAPENIGEMEESVWEIFFSTQKNAYDVKKEEKEREERERKEKKEAEEKKAEERKNEIAQERQTELMKYGGVQSFTALRDMTEDDFKIVLSRAKKISEEKEAEAKRISELGESRLTELLAFGNVKACINDLGKMSEDGFKIMLENAASEKAERDMKEQERKEEEQKQADLLKSDSEKLKEYEYDLRSVLSKYKGKFGSRKMVVSFENFESYLNSHLRELNVIAEEK